MVVVKLHKKEGRILVAVCDSDLVGKRFEEGRLQIDLTGDFFKGEETSDTEAGDIMRNADHVNVVGKKSIALAVEEGIIDESQVQHVQGVPHAQVAIVH